jgi:hypothetical protein
MVLKWRPTALHSSLRDSACFATSRRSQKRTKSNPNGNVNNEGSNEAPVLSPGNNALRKYTPFKWTTAYLAAHPTPLTMTHTKRNSLHRHAFGFSSNLP